jgi:3-oxoacyl-[acyl-carrier protein] reductase
MTNDTTQVETARPLAGQVAIVTGAVRRIGKAIAKALAQSGAAVVINARSSREEADQAAKEIRDAGGEAMVHLADVADEAAVKGMMEAVVNAYGRVDILINNAALRGERHLLDMSLEEWHRITGVVLDGGFLCSREALRHRTARQYGRIINIGGVSAHVGASERAHVLTAKAGIVGFTRALAFEFAEQGVTANCVVPGRIGGQRSATSGKGIGNDPIVSRLGVPEDVSAMVHQLCLPLSAYITGQVIHVNGGVYLS